VGDPLHFGADPDQDPRIRTLTHGSGSGSGYDFKDAKKNISHIFSFNLPTGTLFSILKI
jgi:hypothetical protein